MISNRSGSQQSEFMQALVPMVDLFAVLPDAIVFMIHSNEEITAAQTAFLSSFSSRAFRRSK